MRKPSYLLVLAVAGGCEAATPQSWAASDGAVGADMALAQPVYCGEAGKQRLWAVDCQKRCVPDEPVFFLCTELRGRVAYTRQGLLVPQLYGYSWETEVVGVCLDYPSRVFRLTPLDPPPTNANFGRTSGSTTWADCYDQPKQPPSIEPVDRMYYTPVEVFP